MEIKNKGEIKKLEKNYGTVSSNSMEDLMFDTSELKYQDPLIGDLVSFNLAKNKRGKHYASNIILITKSSKKEKSYKTKFKFLNKNDFNLAFPINQ